MPLHTDATDAAYFRFGFEAGLFTGDEVRNWAFSVIEEREEPPVEIMDVAMSAERRTLFDALMAVPGEPDIQKAGQWLLGLLKKKLEGTPSSFRDLLTIAITAMRVARFTDQPNDLEDIFDSIGDYIFESEHNNCGTLDKCRSDLEAALAPYDEVRAGNIAQSLLRPLTP